MAANDKAREVFDRLVVEKKKTRITDLKEFPRYVIEYLINQFCPGEDFDRELGVVRQKLAKNYASPADAPRQRRCSFTRGTGSRAWWRNLTCWCSMRLRTRSSRTRR